MAFEVSRIAPVQDEPLTLSLVELAHTTRGAATISFAVLSLVAMAVFMYIEARSTGHRWRTVPTDA